MGRKVKRRRRFWLGFSELFSDAAGIAGSVPTLGNVPLRQLPAATRAVHCDAFRATVTKFGPKGSLGWAKVTARRLKHVLKGDFSASGKFLSGLHDINEARTLSEAGKITLVESSTASNGVIQGTINGKFKTFFPASWSEKEIMLAGKVAADQAKLNGTISGNSFVGEFNGVTIQGYIDPATGEIASFFPKWPQ